MSDNQEAEIILKGKFENGQAVIDATSKINKNLDKMGDSAKKAEADSNSLLNTLSKIAAFVGFAKIIQGFKNLVTDSLKAAGTVEQVNVAFTTMLGSAEKAQKLIADLIAFGKKTPFEIEGLFTTTKQLLAFGFAQEEIIPTLTTLGNIAAGLGVDVERLGLVYGQVMTKTRLMGDDLRQFTDAGVPLLNTLAQNLGKTEAEVQEMVSNGQIGFDKVKVALESLTKEGGRFYNLMENQSKTFLGTLSNMNDGFFQVKKALGDALLPVAKEVVTSVNGWFEELRTTIEKNKDAIAKFATAFVKVFIGIKGVLEVVFDVIYSLVTTIKTLIAQPLIKWLGSIIALFYGLRTVLGLIVRSPIIFFITAITAAVGYLIRNFDNLPVGIQIAILKATRLLQKFERDVAELMNALVQQFSVLSKVPGFRDWGKDLNSLNQKIRQTSKDISTLEAGGKIIRDVETAQPPVEELKPQKQEITQEIDPINNENQESKRLKALKAENEALLQEQKAFLEGYKFNQTEADRLIAENKTLTLQKKILQDADYVAQKRNLDQQLINDEISDEEYKRQLQDLSNQAKLDALQTQYNNELDKYRESQTLLNEVKIEMQNTQDENEVEQLRLKLERLEALIIASEEKLVYFKAQQKQKSVQKEIADQVKDTQRKLGFDKEEYQRAQIAANELVGLQNSKHKEIAAIGKAAALFNIFNDTQAGAISAYHALSGIPIVGPALGAAAAAAVIAYGAERSAQVAKNSFAVGTPNIPEDQIAQVHKGEIIVPATFAEAIRSGQLSLSGNTNNVNNSSTNSEIVINQSFDGANFNGNFDRELISSLAKEMSNLISQGIISPMATKRL